MKDAFDIADAFVAHLNSDAVREASPLRIAAVRVDTVVTSRKAGTPTLQVQPWEEQEEPIDNADGLDAKRTVNVCLQCPLDEPYTIEQCRAWLKHLKASCPELTLELGEGEQWQWTGNETVVLLDSDAIERKQYISIFRPTFQNFA
jgi:hypothetical protein